MRGTALIFHSLDPETLERLDDPSSLDSFDPELEDQDENDKYSLSGISLNSHPDSDSISHQKLPERLFTMTPTLSSSSLGSDSDSLSFNTNTTTISNPVDYVTLNFNSSRNINSESDLETKSQNQDHFHESNNNSVNKVVQTNPKKAGSTGTLDELLHSSFSVPLIKSNYHVENETRQQQPQSKAQDFIRDHRRDQNQNHALINSNNNKERNPQYLTKDTQRRAYLRENLAFAPAIRSGLPLSRVLRTSGSGSACGNENIDRTRKSDNGIVDESSNGVSRGFSRFFVRQKENKSRFDIYNLSPQLREELKHIYVY